MFKKQILLNFAHPLPGWLEKRYRIVSIPFQVPKEIVGDKNGTKVFDYTAETIIRAVKNDREVEAAVNTGKYVVVPPDLKAGCIAAIAVLHGLSGHFPKVLWQVRTEAGEFEPIESPVDAQSYREQARSGRNFGAGVAALRETCPRCGKIGQHVCT